VLKHEWLHAMESSGSATAKTGWEPHHFAAFEGGVLIGDVKAGVLTVAAGSRMRGQADFGWDDKSAAKPANGHASHNGTESRAVS